MDYNTFLRQLFARVGGYRVNEYNAAAIQFIRQGAGLEDLESKLPEALAALERNAARLNDKGADDGYRLITIIGELLMPAATKQLFYAQKKEERKLNPLANAMASGMDENVWDADPDARSGDAERDETEREEYPGGEEGDDQIISNPSAECAALEEHIDALFKELFPFCLRADGVANSWRPDYGDRPALPYLVTYDSVTGENGYCDNLHSALNELARVDSERAVRRRDTNRALATQASKAWS